MAKKNFYELVKKTAEELKSRQFSETLFNDLFVAFLNTDDTKVESWKNGEVEKTLEPTKEFKKFITTVLVDYGADAEDAANFVGEYEFKTKHVEKWARPMIDCVLNGYMETGKTFQFYPKEDLCASIGLTKIEKYSKLYKGTYGTTNVEYDEHRKMYRKSSAPAWRKQSTKLESK